MISEELIKKYYPTKEELEKLGDYADMDCVFEEGLDLDDDDIPLPVPPTDNPTSDDVTETISRIVIMDEPEEFADYIWTNIDLLSHLSVIDSSVKEVVELGFKYYIARGLSGSACDLGALYYSGLIFEQDYAKAKELFEMAVDMGNSKALINLGYIYEYGRLGKPDPKKAFEMYARSAALIGNYEALYKFGDMYSKGMAVKKDMRAAVSLWAKSYDASESSLEKGHSAFRLAKVILTDEADDLGLGYDPLIALNFFQEAEFSFRIEIKNGATYYQKSLEEAIEGQKKARELLDAII